MKIYKYWVIEKALITLDGEEQEIKCYGGSNLSEADAVEQARQKIEKVKSKIAGHPQVFEDYQVEIREEIVNALVDRTVITRNRYGAQVLNVQDQMIMDIDQPKRYFWDIFKKRTDDKLKIVEMVRTLAQKPLYQSCSFRIYETSKGMRVIVLGRTFNPQLAETRSMMDEFNCDQLYSYLCKRQDCFRARLTPKPSRMRVPGYRVKYPRDAAADQEFHAWLSGYETASKNYSVCKFIEQIGPASPTAAVRLHDELSGAFISQTLA